MDWDALRHVSWFRFKSFESITFALMPRCFDPSVEAETRVHITNMLPDLVNKGYLRFSTTVRDLNSLLITDLPLTRVQGFLGRSREHHRTVPKD